MNPFTEVEPITKFEPFENVDKNLAQQFDEYLVQKFDEMMVRNSTKIRLENLMTTWTASERKMQYMCVLLYRI